jgi:threonine dehydratase
MGVTMKIQFTDIEKAEEVLKGLIKPTPMLYSQFLSNVCGNEIFLKAENFQRTGSFKIRGAYNRIANLNEEEKAKGVITASAGNHAQGVALAALLLGIKSTIVMPETTPIAKVAATRDYGAEVVLHGSIYDDAYKKALAIRNNIEANFIHAFNDPYIIAGQGTIGIEMLKQTHDLDVIVVPIGGGGLISGIALAAKTIKPEIRIIGVELSSFDAMRKSVYEGELVAVSPAATIAEGIAVKRPGELTFEMVRKYVDDIVTVTEDEIASAILMLLEKEKFISEGAGAAALAALIDKKILFKDKRVGIVISGGNIDINLISMIIHKGLIKSGRKVEFKTILRDKPGFLQDLLNLLAVAKVNIISIQHNREKEGIALGFAEVNMVVETHGSEHSREMCSVLRRKGFNIEIT